MTASTEYLLNIAIGAYEFCSLEDLIAELKFQAGLDRESAKKAIFSWAQNPSIKIDEWGSYYRQK